MSKLAIRKNIKIVSITDQVDDNSNITAGSVVIQFGCSDLVKYNDNSHREKVKIFLQLKDDHYKEFNEDLLQKLAVTVQLVTGFILGPLTVIEIFNDPFLNDIADVIINDTNNKVGIYQKQCYSDKSREKGEFIRSIRLWDYDYYMEHRATKYCKTDFDCELSQYCLCPDSDINGDFCPEQKKRCRPMAEYSDKVQRPMVDSDIVNQQCLDEGIKEYKQYWNSTTIPYGELSKISSFCSRKEFIDKFPQDLSLKYYLRVDNVVPKYKGDGYKMSEHFMGDQMWGNSSTTSTIIIMVLIIGFLLLYQRYQKN